MSAMRKVSKQHARARAKNPLHVEKAALLEGIYIYTQEKGSVNDVTR